MALGVLLGSFGAHNFYAGYNRRGLIQLALTLALGWVVVGFVITGVWALYETATVKADANGRAFV